MASPANGFVLVSTAAFAVFLFGLYGHLTHFEENGCNMTYLFEYPQFVRIPLDDEVAMRHRRYGLYAFAEGSRIEKVRAMKFDGIPVLFVPGSRGSHKQVRSLASVSLRKWLGSRTPFHFDYFALDLDNDHSGLYGGVLKAQTDFLKFCVKRVLSLYRGPVAAKPTSVVLVGHSMGGLVAEGLFLEPDFDSDQVRLIVTLATPHTPALLPDQRMSAYYSRLAHFWSTHRVSMKNLTLVSIGGGARDIIVKSSQTVSKFADINVISPSVSDVWLSVDHYCILWCKELVIVLVRSLFDSVDLTTRQITRDAQLRRDVFRYHLLDRSAGKKYQTSVHPKEMALWSSESGGGWTSLEKNQAVWDRPRGIATTSHITVPLATAADTMVVEGINHKTKDWLFTCRADGSVNGTRIW
ncbi:hypothetical protein AAG570_004774 [Ranatra chinensis]|uniref:GPI inositol-deacylase n=1 Tax=Ranatra chinensis TaxID=642074 RepID=A0ABD0YGF3_9HEMI